MQMQKENLERIALERFENVNKRKLKCGMRLCVYITLGTVCSECGQAGASIKRYNVQVKHERNEKSYDKLNILVRKCITQSIAHARTQIHAHTV